MNEETRDNLRRNGKDRIRRLYEFTFSLKHEPHTEDHIERIDSVLDDLKSIESTIEKLSEPDQFKDIINRSTNWVIDLWESIWKKRG